jgi:hypothetical protein
MRSVPALWLVLCLPTTANANGGHGASAWRTRFAPGLIFQSKIGFPILNAATIGGYLHNLPTSFVLSPEAADRLRAAARTIILSSPEFKRLLKDAGANLVARTLSGNTATERIHD